MAEVEVFFSDEVVLDNLTGNPRNALLVVRPGHRLLDYPSSGSTPTGCRSTTSKPVLRLQGGELEGVDAFHVTVGPDGP